MSELVKTAEGKLVDAFNIIDKAVSEVKDILGNVNKLSRFDSVYKDKPFKTIDVEKFEYITDKIKEINDKMYVFSKSSSQLNKKLMTLTMLFPADSVYRVLYQILAQIEDRQQAILSNISNLKKTYMALLKLKEEISKNPPEDKYAELMIELEMQDLQISLANSFSYLEAAIKEIGYYVESYEQIKKNKNIPDDWDEYDYEQDEIRANIMNAFRNCVRDHLVHGTIGMGTCEYMEQLGISPIEAQYHTRKYLETCNIKIQNGQLPDFDDLYDFLSQMADLYKDSYKKVCAKIGLDDELISRRFTLINNKDKLKQIE